MDAVDYVRGDYAPAVVDDLVQRRAGPIELLFVLESPHVDELREGYPLAGIAGTDALAYLQDRRRNAESLGGFVKSRINAGDGRIGVLNVSSVPLQQSAFKLSSAAGTPPIADWSPLVELRDFYSRSTPRQLGAGAQVVADAIRANFEARLSATVLKAGGHVAICGRIAQVITARIVFKSGTRVMSVRHPANRWWQRSKGQHEIDLIDVRRAFENLA